MLVRTAVQASLIHGLGLFAAEPIPRGTPIWRYEAGFDQEFSPDQVSALPPLAGAHVRWFAYFRKEDGFAVLSGDHACFMNHSATPNTGAARDAMPPVTTIALRDIAAGEELTCDYYEFDAEAKAKLGCDSPNPIT